MKRLGIRGRINRDRAHSEPFGGSGNAAGDLATRLAIENGAKHGLDVRPARRGVEPRITVAAMTASVAWAHRDRKRLPRAALALHRPVAREAQRSPDRISWRRVRRRGYCRWRRIGRLLARALLRRSCLRIGHRRLTGRSGGGRPGRSSRFPARLGTHDAYRGIDAAVGKSMLTIFRGGGCPEEAGAALASATALSTGWVQIAT